MSEYRPFEVVGLELEYPIVDRDLNVKPVVEAAFRSMAGHTTSDVSVGAVEFSNEFADHVFELKVPRPLSSMCAIEVALQSGIDRFTDVLRKKFDARLLPTAMHPWFDPRQARLWTHSGLEIYETYARLFDVRTHGWMNVQASHVNLPFGNEAETVAMLNASAMLIPYLPAIAASSPVYDGKLQPDADGRMAFLTRHQTRLPESMGTIVPEYTQSFADYERSVLQPMYEALDRLPQSENIRDEFLNTRAAILRFGRRALEIRALDTQECVRMDVSIATFVRWSLKHLTEELLARRMELPPHEELVADFHANVKGGASSGTKRKLQGLLQGARVHAPADEMKYLDLVERVIESGSLSERMRARLEPYRARAAGEFNAAVRQLYTELAECLEANEPWEGRWS